MFRRLRARWRLWRNQRFLKKNGCETWRQYRRRNDPDVCAWATRLKDYYQGYPYVHCFENQKHQFYQWDLGYDGSIEIIEWAEAHSEDKVRFDGHRCMKDYWGEWQINEIGGGDYYFAAFKNEQDCFLFKLRWGS